MKTIKGPAIFLAQFAGDTAPFNSLDAIAGWAAGLGYKGVQIPSWDARLFDLKKAAESKTYCDEVKGTLAQHGLEITELSTHLQGQLVAVHPAYDAGFDGFAAPEVRNDPVKRAAMGGRAAALRGAGLGQPRADGARDLLRRAGLALPLLLAAAPAGPDRGSLRRARAALEADPRRLRRSRRRRLLRDPSGRGPARRRDLRDVPRARGQPPARLPAVRPEPLRAAAARLPRLHRPLPRAHQDLPREGRRVQPDRQAGRLRRLPVVDQPRRALPLAGRRAGRLQARSSRRWRPTTSRAGRCSNGSAASSTPKTARAKAPTFIADHIIRVADRAFDDFAGRRRRHGGQPEDAGHRDSSMLG